MPSFKKRLTWGCLVKMARPMLWLARALLILLSLTCTCARVIEHTFHVEGVALQRLCKKLVVTAVNGSLPGPTIYARDGDTLLVHVHNKSPYNMTIHWHGVTQILSCWADGAEYIGQCPIRPGYNFTYKFKLTGQEGILWWHAHSGFQRITVYGALIIYPRIGRSYPFPKPYKEVPIIEWYDQNIVELEQQLEIYGNGPNGSDAFTVNGWPGNLYSCSSDHVKKKMFITSWTYSSILETGRRFLSAPRKPHYTTLELPSTISGLESDIYRLKVTRGKTYLLGIINAALNSNQFFKIANHNMTVVAVNAFYTDPYVTDVITLTSGQTVDVFIIADQPPALYYMASHVYRTAVVEGVDFIPATGIIVYDDAITSEAIAKMPIMPNIYDTATAYKFFGSLTGLVSGPFWTPVPQEIEERMFITVGLGLMPCEKDRNISCLGPNNQRIAASLNNMSFVLPTNMSILEASYYKVNGVYTTDFPDEPPIKFDYTSESHIADDRLVWTEKSTKVKKLKYNTTIEIVFQSHTLVFPETHPMHIHGHNFYVLGQGFGNYDASKEEMKLNLVNPHVRNTIFVPIQGWTIIRFQANNPGIWHVHCHIEEHIPIGLATAFIVENGPTPSTTLPPPPLDLPTC